MLLPIYISLSTGPPLHQSTGARIYVRSTLAIHRCSASPSGRRHPRVSGDSQPKAVRGQLVGGGEGMQRKCGGWHRREDVYLSPGTHELGRIARKLGTVPTGGGGRFRFVGRFRYAGIFSYPMESPACLSSRALERVGRFRYKIFFILVPLPLCAQGHDKLGGQAPE